VLGFIDFGRGRAGFALRLRLVLLGLSRPARGPVLAHPLAHRLALLFAHRALAPPDRLDRLLPAAPGRRPRLSFYRLDGALYGDELVLQRPLLAAQRVQDFDPRHRDLLPPRVTRRRIAPATANACRPRPADRRDGRRSVWRPRSPDRPSVRPSSRRHHRNRIPAAVPETACSMLVPGARVRPRRRGAAGCAETPRIGPTATAGMRRAVGQRAWEPIRRHGKGPRTGAPGAIPSTTRGIGAAATMGKRGRSGAGGRTGACARGRAAPGDPRRRPARSRRATAAAATRRATTPEHAACRTPAQGTEAVCRTAAPPLTPASATDRPIPGHHPTRPTSSTCWTAPPAARAPPRDRCASRPVGPTLEDEP